MRIVANKILTNLELEKFGGDNPKKMIKSYLLNAVESRLIEMDPLFYEEKRDDFDMNGTEYRVELFVLSKETFNNIILTLQETDVRKTTRERIRDILMNSI